MNEKIRVLAICSHPVQYMAPVLCLLSQQPGIELAVAYCSLRGAHATYDPDFDRTVQWDIPLLKGYHWVEIPNCGSGGEGFWGLNNPGLWKHIRDGNFDAILSYTGYVCASFWISYAAARRTHSPFVFGTDASSLAPRDSRNWKVTFKKYFWPHLFRLADQVIVGSTAGVELMLSLGLPNERITLTPFAVDNVWWNARVARVNRSEVRKSWSVAPHELVILYCAKLQSWKRPLDLLRAFAGAAVPDSILVFAGDGPLQAQLRMEAVSLGVDSRVRFLGFVNQSQLPDVYTAADLFVLPSGYDPCPVVVCEAMLCGLPVLLSDQIRGRLDLVRSGITGEVFPCGNVDALAAMLQRVLGDRPGLETLGRNAKARMESWSPFDNVRATVSAVIQAIRHRQATER